MIKNKEQYLGKYCRVVYQQTLIDGSHNCLVKNMNITDIKQLENEFIIEIKILRDTLRDEFKNKKTMM